MGRVPEKWDLIIQKVKYFFLQPSLIVPCLLFCPRVVRYGESLDSGKSIPCLMVVHGSYRRIRYGILPWLQVGGFGLVFHQRGRFARVYFFSFFSSVSQP